MPGLKSVGSRAQVMHGNAKKTSGGLTKSQLKYNKQGRIVSRKASALAKKNNRLVKAGYVTKKGQFGAGGKMRGGEGFEKAITDTEVEKVQRLLQADKTLVNTMKEEEPTRSILLDICSTYVYENATDKKSNQLEIIKDFFRYKDSFNSTIKYQLNNFFAQKTIIQNKYTELSSHTDPTKLMPDRKLDNILQQQRPITNKLTRITKLIELYNSSNDNIGNDVQCLKSS